MVVSASVHSTSEPVHAPVVHSPVVQSSVVHEGQLSCGLSADHLASIRWTAEGLVAAIVQDVHSRDVLMMAWMNAETLAMSLSEGRTVFWSRSRQEVWRKGDTSGDRQFIMAAWYDCDGDTLLFEVVQEGKGACHTGNRTCFFTSFADQRSYDLVNTSEAKSS
jgi:phosphoribosyl-AMP cyclohydrolase